MLNQDESAKDYTSFLTDVPDKNLKEETERNPSLKMFAHSRQAVKKYGLKELIYPTPSGKRAMTNEDWLTALMEEIGEVSKEMNNFGSLEELYNELGDAGGVIINWMESIRTYLHPQEEEL